MIGNWFDLSRSRTIGIFLALFLAPVVASAAWDDDKGCLTCHEGIERISDGPAMSTLSCTFCHKGNGAEKSDKTAAHKGMYANPADFRVADKTCGVCHADHLANGKKSLHATMAGMISSTRYAFGAQDRISAYATYAVDGGPTDRPGAVAKLDQVPKYDPTKPDGATNTPGDDYLRNQCLRCHLWSGGAQATGDHRASGCAACHVVYSDKGVYEGSDKAIAKDSPDAEKGIPARPKMHKITTKVPEYQCLHCHNRGGRTGVSFIGTMESDNYGSPYKADGGKQGSLHGKQYNHLTADIHYQKGMSCVDCHTAQDLHGDGRIYQKKENAVEVRCETCHGTVKEAATFKSVWGNKLNNIQMKDGRPVLVAKLSGKEHPVPQLKGAKLSEAGHTAMVAVPKHMEKLECYACHAKWAPQCYGCHTSHDVGKPSRDWLADGTPEDPSKAGTMSAVGKSAFTWNESRSYLRWETPILGINHKGKVSPFIPGCQVIYTQSDSDKKTQKVNNQIFTTVHGTSGLMHNPIQPYTISREGRTCADRHMTSKALGLGNGIYNAKANFPAGTGPDFELERIVDEEGKQLQGTAHEGARPFNKEEQMRISRVGVCIACHGSGKVALKNKAPTDELHTKALRAMLPK
jgi:hypothetical protein